MDLFIRASAGWAGLLVLAFVNGALREVGMKKGLKISEPLAHRLSCLTGAALWTGFVFLVWDRLGIGSPREAAWVGAYWFGLTLLVETFLLNRLIGKLSWKEILHTYNAAQGEFWGLVVLYIAFLPAIMLRLRG